jgi:hypothetical protein
MQDMDQVLYIVGKDWAGNQITDAIQLNDTDTVDGKKAFMKVDAIWYPARTAQGQAVEVGISENLGLYDPISVTTDVIQQGRMAFEADPAQYIQESTGWSVDADYSTIDPGTLTDKDSFEWAILADQ